MDPIYHDSPPPSSLHVESLCLILGRPVRGGETFTVGLHAFMVKKSQ